MVNYFPLRRYWAKNLLFSFFTPRTIHLAVPKKRVILGISTKIFLQKE
ncbi:UNVERIFIED_CONTAM: hypothetical protein GTU68_029291 [Idotea baltica]|nr:hypothetical protein [Idotea baltica]